MTTYLSMRVLVAPYNKGGQPPPYEGHTPLAPGSTTGGQTLFVQCRVCQNIIHVAPTSQSRVVKCPSCNEATVWLLLLLLFSCWLYNNSSFYQFKQPVYCIFN